MEFWSSLSSGYISISAAAAKGLPSQDLISGMIDTLILDPIKCTVAIEGRDLSASMIDGYRQQDFVNQTASEVVSTIAAFHGLIPMVTATPGAVGRYYGDGYTRLSLGQFSRLRSDWDLVVQLARENSFDVFVQSETLYFQPGSTSEDLPTRLGFGDVKSMHFERALALAPSTTARVQSWNSQNMASYTGAGETTNSEQTLSAGPAVQPFLFSASNFTSQQVTNSAGQYTAELTRLGLVLRAEMPWNFALVPRSQVYIDDAGSGLDTIYQIDHVERHYSTTSGSTQKISAVVV